METSSSPTLTPPIARDVALCPHFGICGGCTHQDEPYSAQLIRKENFVRTSFGDLPVAVFHPILPSSDLFFYRNKMEFAFGDNFDLNALKLAEVPGSVHVGLHPKGRFSITTPTPDCRLLSEEANAITRIVGEWATEFSIPVYIRPKNKGVLRHLVIREGKNTNERIVLLVATSALTHQDELEKRLRSVEKSITTFIIAKHDGLSDVARGSESQVIWGNGWIREKVGRVEFRVSPYSFMQTNTRAAEGMINLLREWVTPSTLLLDLYCGAGTLGLNLADLFGKVIGMECEAESVANAKETAERNGIRHAEFELGRIEKLLDRFPHERTDVSCIVDPSRAGLHPDVAKALLNSGFPSIIYVSCNPVSLAKDLKVLVSKYSIDEVQPLDFFPHTDHVETMVKLSLNK